MTEVSHTDIHRHGWMDRWVPAPLRPYGRLARLDRPIGTWLLLFPCWWSIGLAGVRMEMGAIRTLWLMLLFGIGAVVMRGAGCVINDILDRDIDAMVARTAVRPLASGEVTVKQALMFLALLLLIGLAVLTQLNKQTFVLGLCGSLLAGVYPLMKRATGWPQAWLGITFTWGAIMGWAAVAGRLDGPAIVLYAACFFWSLGYDTIYAHQDKADDRAAGIGSSALSLGDARTPPFLFAVYGMAILLTAIAGAWAGLSGWMWVGLVPAALQLAWQAYSVDLDSPADCLLVFRANRIYGWMILIAILLGAAF